MGFMPSISSEVAFAIFSVTKVSIGKMSQWGSHQHDGTSQLQLVEPGSEQDHKTGDVGANGHKSHPIFDTIKSG